MPAAYMSMSDLAKLYGVSPSTARKWAAHDHWRRTTGKPRRYHGADVQASYDKHHGGRTMRHLASKYSDHGGREDSDHG